MLVFVVKLMRVCGVIIVEEVFSFYVKSKFCTVWFLKEG